MDAFLLAVVVVFLAELGDKSQLIAMTLATRRPAVPVLLGVAGAALLLQGLSAGFGAALSDTVPQTLVMVVAGLGFLVAAVLTLRSSPDDADDSGVVRRYRSTVVVAFATLVVAELGDKTMIATAALAARDAPVLTWLGGSLGFLLADALAVVAGVRLLRRLPVAAVRRGTALLFAVLGGALLVGAV